MKILVINGPNLNLLGIRQPENYGQDTLEEIMTWLETSLIGSRQSFKFYQSNHEGEIIDTIHDERHWAEGIIINPGALTHYSYSISDAISAINTPTFEVHLSDINSRENFRKQSVISPVCIEQISGMGKHSYIRGIEILTQVSI